MGGSTIWAGSTWIVRTPVCRKQTSWKLCLWSQYLSIDVILFLDHTAENATGTLKTPANWQHAMRSHAALTFEVVLIYSKVTVRVTQPEHWFLLPWLQYRSVKLIKRGHTSLFTTLIHVNRLVLTVSVWYRAAANIRALLVGNFNHLVRTTQVLLLWKT